MVFVNCHNRLQQTPDDTKWKAYESTGDVRLEDKGKYGMDSRIVWFVVETRELYDSLSVEYPGKILLCDRSFILDTHKNVAIDGTTKLHEVSSTVPVIPELKPFEPRKWPVIVSDLPCNCQHYIVNRENNQCIYKAWRKTRLANMQIACLRPAEAEFWSIGDKVA